VSRHVLNELGLGTRVEGDAWHSECIGCRSVAGVRGQRNSEGSAGRHGKGKVGDRVEDYNFCT
jgi:hypothetical protein